MTVVHRFNGKWVERMTVREGLSPFSGIICEIVCSVGQGNFTFVRKKSGKFRKGCGNHVKHVHPFVIFKHVLLRNIILFPKLFP